MAALNSSYAAAKVSLEKKKTIRLERDSNSIPDSHTGSVLNQLSSQRQTIKISKELVCQEIYQLLPLTENSLSLVIAKK